MGVKVTELTEALNVNEEDLIMIVQDGVNKKVTASKVGTGQAGGDTLPIGSIMQYPGNTIPESWLLCDGQAVSRSEYPSLFNKIGTIYGAGDGSTTFNLPDLRGKSPIGKDENDEDFDTLGNTGGEKEHTLTKNEMPEHNHGIKINVPVSAQQYSSGTARWPYQSDDNVHKWTENVGGGQAHNNLQPYIVQNYIIKARQSAGTATLAESLPVGSEIEFNGDSEEIPVGWEEVDDPYKYSTNETVVGKWIDGKPLYRKTFSGNTLPTTGEKKLEINVSSLDIEKGFIDVTHSYFHDTTNGRYYPIPVVNVNTSTTTTANSSAQAGVYLKSDYSKMVIEGGYNMNWSATITIEYTKTTD